MRALLLALVLALVGQHALADALTPFLPAAATRKFVEALTPPDFLDPAVVSAFERETGLTVALDTYASEAELTEMRRERRYDLLILSGPALARRLGALAPLDRRRLKNFGAVQPAVAAKLSAYDRDGARAVAFGWSAFGVLYDADKWSEPPVSWGQAFGLGKETRRAGDCAIVWPDAPRKSFMAAWRLLGVDPARARAGEIKSAAAVIERARRSISNFAAADEVGAFAKGAACIGAGTAGEAAAVASRGFDNPPNVRFAYPREGAPLTLYALAIPADAPSPDAAYRLLDALLQPDAARRDAAYAGVNGAEQAADLEQLKRLAPEPDFDAATLAAMQTEWKRLTAAK